MNRCQFIKGTFASAVLASASVLFPLPALSTTYGVCAHVTRDEYAERGRTYEMVAKAGFKAVRSDFDWARCQKAKDAPFDFSFYDSVVDDAAKCGLTILPILYGPPQWGYPVYEHLDAWRSFVRETARHFRNRIPVYEIWNEENIDFFWKHPDPVKYAEVLKAAYEEIKAINPKLRVAFGGTAGCDWAFVERVINAGAGDAFDIVNIHPYRQPNPPEPGISEDLGALKAMMVRHGIADRPIWITEMGWPTLPAAVPDAAVLRAGLQIAEPRRMRWRAAYLDLMKDGSSAQAMASEILKVLPKDSTCKGVNATQLTEDLRRCVYDLVVFPFGEFYPEEIMESTVEFVRKGGTLVVMGGYPLYSSYRSGEVVESTKSGVSDGAYARYRLRIAARAWWEDKSLPESTKVFPSELADKVGLKVNPTGLDADRFLFDSLLQPGDKFIALLTGNDKNRNAVAAAGVYRFDSDMKGRVIVSTTSRGRIGTAALSEGLQARYTIESMQAAAKLGVERYFIYEFRAVEEDPLDAEHFFGIVHKNFAPKKAYEACRRFLKEYKH